MTSDRDRRPRRNRVTPFGEIVATHHKGDLMGNRGCLHDARGMIVRQSHRDAWIACLPTWPGIRRTIMAPGHYTELFFLDEATALGAGHRPCGDCRRDRLEAFKAAWAKALRLSRPPLVGEIDAVLVSQRKQPRQTVQPADVPEGAMVTLPQTDAAWLRWEGGWRRWSFEGYSAPEVLATPQLLLLTPPAIVRVLEAGYVPQVRHQPR
jgi:hypothetical protein